VEAAVKTWHVEMAIVAVVVGFVAAFGGGGWSEWIGAGAVLLSFGHAQVADRLAESEARNSLADYSDRHYVECHRWATRYLVGKETLWCVYFIVHGSWSALAGVALFLAYPLWRRWWRS
jgi:hypothetical protein